MTEAKASFFVAFPLRGWKLPGGCAIIETEKAEGEAFREEDDT